MGSRQELKHLARLGFQVAAVCFYATAGFVALGCLRNDYTNVQIAWFGAILYLFIGLMFGGHASSIRWKLKRL